MDLFVQHTNPKYDTSCVFSHTDTPRRIDAWQRYVSISVKYPSSFIRTQRFIAHLGNRTNSQCYAVVNLRS